jgi:Ca2+-binding EF-hand superfamily protein
MENAMNRPIGSIILRCGANLFACCLLADCLALRAQQFTTSGTAPWGGAKHTFQTGGESGLIINGDTIGTVLLKTCDLNKDGGVTLAEFKEVAAASFKLWDSNTDGSISTNELSMGLKELFPAPPAGGVRGMRILNGVAVEVSPEGLPTPDRLIAKRLLAGADSNNDAALTFQEVSAFLLGKCFGEWDQDGNDLLDALELSDAFSQLAKPDDAEGGFQLIVAPLPQ